MNELTAVVKEHNPDTIGVSEVLPKKYREQVYPEQFKIEGYDMIPHPNVENNTGRGSILYIKEDLIHMPVEIKGPGLQFEEHILQQIKIDDNESMIIALLYRSPSSTHENNMHLLELLKELDSLKPEAVSMGDINLKFIDWKNMTISCGNNENFSHIFLDCVNELNLTQHVSENTRKRGADSPSCLDLVLSSDMDYITNLEQLAPIGKSDHSIIKFETPFNPPADIPKIRVCYDKGDYKAINDKLSKVDWIKEFKKYPDDVNKQWDFFKECYYAAESEHIPRKKVFINGKLSKKLSVKFDKKTLALRKKKNRIWCKMRKNLATEEEELSYNRLRNQVKSLCNKAKRSVEKVIAKNSKSNPKGFWAYSQAKLKTKSTMPDLIKPGTEKNPEYVKTDAGKAEVLVEYFSSVFTVETDLLNMPPFEERQYDQPLDDLVITEATVLEKLQKLKINKSPKA